jgi:hypothetical protein
VARCAKGYRAEFRKERRHAHLRGRKEELSCSKGSRCSSTSAAGALPATGSHAASARTSSGSARPLRSASRRKAWSAAKRTSESLWKSGRARRRIEEVFGRAGGMVRFRSSSTMEDLLEFNGAGLYDSTSACAAADLDLDGRGPSHCDPSQPDERGIERALKRVWASPALAPQNALGLCHGGGSCRGSRVGSRRYSAVLFVFFVAFVTFC